jgi:hypothetical protein
VASADPAPVVMAAKALIEALRFDDSGNEGRGGNGGLLSRETIRKADELRIAIGRYERAADRQ